MDIVLYTPTYYNSPGTQARVDLIRKSLEIFGHKTILVSSQELRLKKIYNRLGERLLTLANTWKMMGKYISRSILEYKPKIVILFIDVSASAIPYLKECGVRTILSMEDLTPEYKNYSLKASQKFYQVFKKNADQADSIISSGYTLSKRLEHMGLKSIPVPIGLECFIPIEEALARPKSPTILHTGQLNTKRQMEILLDLADRYRLLIHDFGILANKLISHHNIELYREPTVERAALRGKNAHIGLIIEYRKAYTLSRLYFHTSLLQPLIAEGQGPWVEEASSLGISLHPLNELEEIVRNYDKHVRELAKIREKLAIPQVHRPLLSLLE